MAEHAVKNRALSFPPPPDPSAPVSFHVARDDSDDQLLLVSALDGIEPGTVYVAELSVYLPGGEVIDAISFNVHGYYAERYKSAELDRRDVWQDLLVQARVPDDQNRLVVTLAVRAAPGALVLSSGLRLARKSPTTRPVATTVQRYRIVPLADLVGRDDVRVRRTPCLPNVVVPIPAVSFGQTSAPDHAVQWPPDEWTRADYRVDDADRFELHDAVVHGEQGFITVGRYFVAETLHFADVGLAGFFRDGDDSLVLDQVEPEITVTDAAHLLCGYVGNRNYAHWWVDVVPAVLVSPFHDAFDDAVLLWPKLRAGWQAETLKLLPETNGKSVFVGEQTRVHCERLRFIPALIQSDMAPHPIRLPLLDAVRQRAGYRGETGRRLYVSRLDAGARRLLNEHAVIDVLAGYGFESVVMSEFGLTEQIKLFAAASFIVSPHGAGLGNVIFCAPGTVLCELQMLSNVQWSVRRLAALTGMHYGCVIGTADDDTLPVDRREWTIPLDALEHAIQDVLSRFGARNAVA